MKEPSRSHQGKPVEHGNVTAAAIDLGASQPALSKQLGRLGRELGNPPLERLSRGVQPSASTERSLNTMQGPSTRITAAHCGIFDRPVAGRVGKSRLGLGTFGFRDCCRVRWLGCRTSFRRRISRSSAVFRRCSGGADRNVVAGRTGSGVGTGSPWRTALVQNHGCQPDPDGYGNPRAQGSSRVGHGQGDRFRSDDNELGASRRNMRMELV